MGKESTKNIKSEVGKGEFTEQKWKEICQKFPEANFLQSPSYQKMCEQLGFKTVVEDFDRKGHALMIVRDAKRGRYLEIPCGPLIDWSDKNLAKKVISQIREVAAGEKCVFVRIRPQLRANADNLKTLRELGLKESPMHLAAEHTVMIDLIKTEEELLSNMRRQTRYEVRRAEKLGVEVISDNSEEIFQDFHKTQVATAKRQNFIPPDMPTLKAEKEAFGENIRIYIARVADSNSTDEADEQSKAKRELAVAYGLIIRDGREGDYYEAASTELNRKIPGAYALLWRAMRDLKAEGCERFNLWGIAPKGQPNHRYAGVTTFKTGFGGEVVEYVPAHDLVISKVGYLKDLIVEKARKKKRHL